MGREKEKMEDKLICRGHILNALFDQLYNLYINTTSTEEICDALENKYKVKEEGINKFLISKYFNFKMLDNIPLLSHVHELQMIINRLKVESNFSNHFK